MNEYLAGVLTGMLFAIFNAILLKRDEVRVGKMIDKISEKVSPREKVEFLPPIDSKTEALEQVIEENDKKGIDTPINEI